MKGQAGKPLCLKRGISDMRIRCRHRSGSTLPWFEIEVEHVNAATVSSDLLFQFGPCCGKQDLRFDADAIVRIDVGEFD